MPNYIDVIAKFNANGIVTPLFVLYQGHHLQIDRVLDVRLAASRKASGCGMRYLCCIRGREVPLFFYENKWFYEPKN